MDTKITLSAVVLGLVLAAGPAAASDQGILTCQITLSQFADDVAASKARLNASQLHEARQILDIGRGQCRSGPQIVMTDVRVARNAMRLSSSGNPTYAYSDFWPASPQELASLSR